MQTCTIKIEGNILAKGSDIEPNTEGYELVDFDLAEDVIQGEREHNFISAQIDLKFGCLKEFKLDLDDNKFCIDRSQFDAYNKLLFNIGNVLSKLKTFSNHESGDELKINGILRFYIENKADNSLSYCDQTKLEKFELNSLEDLEKFLSFARSNSPKLKPEFITYRFGSFEEGEIEHMPIVNPHEKLKMF